MDGFGDDTTEVDSVALERAHVFSGEHKDGRIRWEFAKLGGKAFFKPDTVDGVDAGFAKADGCCARDGEVTAADQ